jgi:hypothetical protein
MTALSNVTYHVDDVLDLWDPVVRDDSITECELTYLSENTNALAQNGGIPTQGARYSFQSTDQDSYCLPSRSFLNIQCQITNVAGAAIAANDPGLAQGIAVQNNFPLFDSCIFTLNGQIIHQTPNWLARKHLVKNLLDYSNDNSGTTFLDQGWSLDEGLPLSATTTQCLGVREPEYTTYLLGATSGPAAGVGIVATTKANPYFNKGFLQRSNLVTNYGLGTGVFNVRIPLNRLVDILAIDRVYVGASLGLQLIVGPQNVPNLLQVAQIQTYTPATNVISYNPIVNGTPTNANGPYNVQIKNIYWCMPYLRLDPGADLALKRKMIENPVSMSMYEDCTTFVNSYPPNATSLTVNWLIQTADQKLSKVIIGFTWANQFNDATQANNSQVFANVSQYIQNAYLRYGQTLYPRNQYKPQIGAALGGIVQPLAAMQGICNRLMDFEGGSSFNVNSFANNGQYFLLPFDLRNTPTGAAFSPGQTMDVFLNLTMGPTLSGSNMPTNLGNLTVWAYVFSEKTLKYSYAGGKILVNA